MTDNELFGISEQLESSHFADPSNMVGDSVSRQAAVDVAVQSINDWDGMFIQEANCRIRDAINELPPAQQIPWDRKTRNSMAGTLQMLRRLAYNIHGVMDVVDDDNVRRLIEWLEGGQDGTD